MACLVSEMKKVAVKFCGGCDPTFDRGQYWLRIKEASGSRVAWVSPDDEGYDAVLVITGCPTACPVEYTSFDKSSKIVVITDEKEGPEKIIEKLIT